MKPRLLLFATRCEGADSLVRAAGEAGWDFALAGNASDLIEKCKELAPHAVLLPFALKGGEDGLRLASALWDPDASFHPAVILAAPRELADDIRPLASTFGIADVVCSEEAGPDPEALRQVLQRLGEALSDSSGTSIPGTVHISDAALRFSDMHRDAALGYRRLEAVARCAEMAAHQISIEDLAPVLLDWAVSLSRSKAGWLSFRSLSAPEGLFTVTQPAGLDRESLNLALSLIQETVSLDARELREEASLWAALGFCRILVCPLASGTSGWLGVADAEAPFGAGERLFLEALASILALHSRNSAAFQQAKTATEESKALFKAATLILPYEEPQVVARQVTQTVASVLGYPHCAVLLPSVDGKNLHLSGSAGALERVKALLPLDGLGLTVQAFRTGRMIYCPNTAQSPLYVSGWQECRTELAIPLVHRNEILGVLDLQSSREQAFQGKDLRVLEAFAQRVGTLLYAARQYQSLNVTKERYESLCEGAPMGLFTWSMNTGRIEQASAVLKSWAGGDVEGQLVDSILSPSSREVWRRWSSREDLDRAPFSASVQIAGSEGIPPIDCHLTAYPGRGRLQIPGHAVLLAKASADAPELAEGPVPSCTGQGIRVRLAEPDPVWSSVMRIMLEEWGYLVAVSSDLRDLEGSLESGPDEAPGLVIVEHALLASEGSVVLSRWSGGKSRCPLLVLGGPNGEEVPAPNIRRLARPFRMKELQEALNELLAGS